MTRIIIAGGRKFNDFLLLSHSIIQYCMSYDIHTKDVEIVSGCAKGADALGIRFADVYGLQVKKFPADWKRNGKSAGYERNAVMADYGEILIAFWDGKSKGTKHMIDISNLKGLEVHVVTY